MTDIELYELPVAVREHFESIPDSDFDNNATVIAAHARLAELTTQQMACSAAYLKDRNLISELEARRDACKLEAQRLDNLRPAKIAAELLNGVDNLENDRKDMAEIERLRHFAEAVDKALPSLASHLQELSNRTGVVASQETGAAEHLRSILDNLKLARAKRLAFP